MAASDRIREFVEALPLRPGMRVLEIGCGPGVAARLVAAKVAPGLMLAIDRSTKAVAQARAASAAEIAAGVMMVRQSAVENFALETGEAPFDLAFAMRVRALDGRHPELERRALQCIGAALTPSGRLFLDGGNPLREITPLR